MDILGIGPLEIILVLLIALIIIGPRDMAKVGRTFGRTMRKVVTSPYWHALTRTSQEIRNLPTRLIREAGLEEVEQDLARLNQETRQIQQVLRDATILPPSYSIAGQNENLEENSKEALREPDHEIGIPDSPGVINQARASVPSAMNLPDDDPLVNWITPPDQPGHVSIHSIDYTPWITPASPDLEDEGNNS